jgi:hypothetical protein
MHDSPIKGAVEVHPIMNREDWLVDRLAKVDAAAKELAYRLALMTGPESTALERSNGILASAYIEQH